jgi:hypothetical protein
MPAGRTVLTDSIPGRRLAYLTRDPRVRATSEHDRGVPDPARRAAPDLRQCHDEILEAYHAGNHFDPLAKAEQREQRLDCVTCHDPSNTSVPDVTKLEAACARCCDEGAGNKPGILEQGGRPQAQRGVGQVLMDAAAEIAARIRYLSATHANRVGMTS